MSVLNDINQALVVLNAARVVYHPEAAEDGLTYLKQAQRHITAAIGAIEDTEDHGR